MSEIGESMRAMENGYCRPRKRLLWTAVPLGSSPLAVARICLSRLQSDGWRAIFDARKAQVSRIENVFAFHRAKRRILFRQKDRTQKIGYASCIPAQIAGASGGGIARQGQTAFAVLRLHCARGDDLAACPAGAEADCAMVKHPPRQRMFPSSCAVLLLRSNRPVLAHRPCLRFHAFSLRTIPRHSLTA